MLSDTSKSRPVERSPTLRQAQDFLMSAAWKSESSVQS